MKRNVIGVACAVVVFAALVLIFGTVGRDSNAPQAFIIEAVDAIAFLIAYSCDLSKRFIITLAIAALATPPLVVFFIARGLAGLIDRKVDQTKRVSEAVS